MKKLLLTTTLALMGMFSFAQSAGLSVERTSVAKPNIRSAQELTSRTVTCPNDTAFYTFLKEEELGTSTYYTTALYDELVTEYTQTFLNTGSLSIKGISFFGFVADFPNPAQTVSTTLVLYNVDAMNQPTTQITTATVTVGTAFDIYNATFSVPVTVTGNYAVGVKNTSMTDTVVVYLNDAMTTSYGEGLGYLNAPLAGGWYDPSVFGPGIASEGLIAPILSYTINTDFLMSPSAAPWCLGDPIVLSNVTTPLNILQHRMYNYGAFNAYWNTVPDSIFAWDMGNGSPLIWMSSHSYTYPAAGTDTITLFTLSGLFTSCVDMMEKYVTITPDPVANFTVDASLSPVYSFTSTSTDATTYSWDFGDGSPLDNTANPTHTYVPGTYTVMLTVTNACGMNMTSTVITVVATGIDAITAAEGLNMYPNPSTGLVTISLNSASQTVVAVYNVLGEQVYSEIYSSLKKDLDLSHLNAGMYSIRINNEKMNITRQLVLTK